MLSQDLRTKAFDDQSAEVRDTAVGDVTNDAEEEEKIKLDVTEGLGDLVPFEVLRPVSASIGRLSAS